MWLDCSRGMKGKSSQWYQDKSVCVCARECIYVCVCVRRGNVRERNRLSLCNKYTSTQIPYFQGWMNSTLTHTCMSEWNKDLLFCTPCLLWIRPFHSCSLSQIPVGWKRWSGAVHNDSSYSFSAGLTTPVRNRSGPVCKLFTYDTIYRCSLCGYTWAEVFWLSLAQKPTVCVFSTAQRIEKRNFLFCWVTFQSWHELNIVSFGYISGSAGVIRHVRAAGGLNFLFIHRQRRQNITKSHDCLLPETHTVTYCV